MGFVPRRGLFRSRRRVPRGRGGDRSRAGWLELPPVWNVGSNAGTGVAAPWLHPETVSHPDCDFAPMGIHSSATPSASVSDSPVPGSGRGPGRTWALPPRPSGWPWKQVRERAAVRTAAGHAAAPGPAHPGRLSRGLATPGPGCGCPREEAAEAGAVGGFPTRPDALGARSRTPTLPPGHGRRVKRCSASLGSAGEGGQRTRAELQDDRSDQSPLFGKRFGALSSRPSISCGRCCRRSHGDSLRASSGR